MVKAVFFDLDGSLLPMDEEKFTKSYFSLLCKKAEPYGYEKEKLVQTVWAGTKAIKNNDGSKLNHELFWDVFSSVYGKEESEKMEKVFDEFYKNEFKQTKTVCYNNPYAREIVDFCKQNGLKLAITTSPFFPKQGVISRLEFLGLKESDVDFITHYSNTKFSKPNPEFYKEVMKALNVEPNEVVMFGNSETDDGFPIKNLGAKVFMVGEFISVDEQNDSHIEHISLSEVVEKLKNL